MPRLLMGFGIQDVTFTVGPCGVDAERKSATKYLRLGKPISTVRFVS